MARLGVVLPPHEQGYAQQAFVAHDGEFRRCAILHHIQQRDDGRGRKVDPPQRRSRFNREHHRVASEPIPNRPQFGRNRPWAAHRAGGSGGDWEP